MGSIQIKNIYYHQPQLNQSDGLEQCYWCPKTEKPGDPKNPDENISEHRGLWGKHHEQKEYYMYK